ncbi:predicted protein [Histoplasma mississippiense (nom. inval.)]|uniref:predicted protein n=1 Tax=Ajellomyces capsulatus (strain NAm1 / WU24) TaxID=2059318 RepID=UPI000157C498|nr:predicted protein [Histoplasma mississippiense (nom. inval.)]EDN08929.1 predicted protein [Histoplasma mississippiense (nom. inval.)]
MKGASKQKNLLHGPSVALFSFLHLALSENVNSSLHAIARYVIYAVKKQRTTQTGDKPQNSHLRRQQCEEINNATSCTNSPVSLWHYGLAAARRETL